MNIRTLICSTLLASAMGLGMAGTAQADSGYYGSRPHERDHHGAQQRRHHDRGHPYGLHRKALQRHHRHHRKHDACRYDRRARQDRHHERHDGHDGGYNHRSSHRSGIGYTGRL